MNLRIERVQVEQEVDRAGARLGLWQQAAAVISTDHPKTFQADVAVGRGSAERRAYTSRAEAGAALRELLAQYRLADGIQCRRLTEVVGRYRGLALAVQAHPVFEPDLVLALPTGEALETISATTDIGVWQSVTRLISSIPELTLRAEQRITTARARIAAIDRELIRLETWEGQEVYDAAAGELMTINAAFAAAEERPAGQEPVPATAEPGHAAPPASENLLDPAEIAVLLARLADEEGAEAICDELSTIPPAPASLAWMAAELERRGDLHAAPPESGADTDQDTAGLCQTIAVDAPHIPRIHSKASVQFGSIVSTRRRPKAPPSTTGAPAAEGESAQQLSLF